MSFALRDRVRIKAPVKFYRLSKPVDNGVSAGFAWFSNKAEAMKAKRKHDHENGPEDIAEMSVVEIEPTKIGILRALNRYADYPDNG